MNKTAAVFSFKEIVFLIFFFMFYFAYFRICNKKYLNYLILFLRNSENNEKIPF